MRVKHFGSAAALLAVTGAAVAIGAAPIATADECDPTASVCQGPDVQAPDSSPDFGPAPDMDTGGAPSEMQVTDDNPGIMSPSHR